SVLLTLMLFLSAPWIAGFYDEPQLTSITRVISVTFLLGGLTMVHRTRFTKKIDFKTISKIDIIAAIGAMGIGIGMAMAGYGVWSLVGLQVTTSLITCVGFWGAASWRPSFIYNHDSIKTIFTFGLNIFGTDTLN